MELKTKKTWVMLALGAFFAALFIALASLRGFSPEAVQQISAAEFAKLAKRKGLDASAYQAPKTVPSSNGWQVVFDSERAPTVVINFDDKLMEVTTLLKRDDGSFERQGR